jgi:hypothetical protein
VLGEYISKIKSAARMTMWMPYEQLNTTWSSSVGKLVLRCGGALGLLRQRLAGTSHGGARWMLRSTKSV